MTRRFVAVLLAASALVVVPTAGAKLFRPGDLRVCNARHCAAITSRIVLAKVGRFDYGSYDLTPRPRPALRTRFFELRFRNGYVSGIVAGAHLDRFLSYGVNLGRFEQGQWYAVPRRLSTELRRLTRSLRPLRLTRAALARSH